MACRRSAGEPMLRRSLIGGRAGAGAAWRAAVVLAAVLASIPAAARRPGLLRAAEVTTLAAGDPPITRLAATANGQIVCGLAAGGGIVAIDPAAAAAPRELVKAAASGERLAIGCLPGDVTAVVVRSGDEWSLRTYRVRPNTPDPVDTTLQEIRLGRSTGTAEHVTIAVSRVRGWLAIAGLPEPLPPVARVAVAGVRLGAVSDRGCPTLGDGIRPVAAAVGPFDELILAVQQRGEPPAIAYFDASGRELLRLTAGLDAITGLQLGSEDGMLWATGTDGEGREGLWRLDAALHEGRQVIRPTLIAPLAGPRAVACSSPRAIVVAHGPAPKITLVNPLDPGDSP
jgi:hypothetical protein